MSLLNRSAAIRRREFTANDCDRPSCGSFRVSPPTKNTHLVIFLQCVCVQGVCVCLWSAAPPALILCDKAGWLRFKDWRGRETVKVGGEQEGSASHPAREAVGLLEMCAVMRERHGSVNARTCVGEFMQEHSYLNWDFHINFGFIQKRNQIT